MIRDRYRWIFLLACVVTFPQLSAKRLEAQQAKASAPKALKKEAPAPARVWRSLTTGKEYRVRVEGQSLYAEWVNIPPALAERGAYIRSECRRVGTKWIGTSRSYLPCTLTEGGKEQIRNWCRLLTRIEIDAATETTITGRAEGLRRFDCKTCKILETVWKDFRWIPK